MQQQNMPSTATQGEEKNSSSTLVVGIVVVIVLAILGGLYFWGAKLETEAIPQEIPADEMPLVVPTTPSSSVESSVEAEDLGAAVGASVDALPPVPEAPTEEEVMQVQ